jgi:hypothetical protein
VHKFGDLSKASGDVVQRMGRQGVLAVQPTHRYEEAGRRRAPRPTTNSSRIFRRRYGPASSPMSTRTTGSRTNVPLAIGTLQHRGYERSAATYASLRSRRRERREMKERRRRRTETRRRRRTWRRRRRKWRRRRRKLSPTPPAPIGRFVNSSWCVEVQALVSLGARLTSSNQCY